MIRILFWILIASFVGVIVWLTKHPNTLTTDESILIWGSITTVIFFLAACALAIYLCWALKKRVVSGAGYNRAVVFWRDSQPFGYWRTMIIYLVLFVLFSIVTYLKARELLPLLVKQWSNN
jgi:hypothetical protein